MNDDSLLTCEHCGISFPEQPIPINELITGSTETMPVCIKAPARERWLIDSGINGHMFRHVCELKS